MRVQVYSRTGCHLCDEALAVVAQVCAVRGLDHEVIDVDADPTLRAEFGDHVPVTVVDGRPIARWFLAPEALEAALDD